MIVSLKGKRILIVDDEPEIRDLIKDTLEAARAQVTVASDAIQAQSLIHSNVLDAIVLDIRLPGASGLQVALLARSSRHNSKVHIIIASGAIDADALKRAAQLGITDIIVKPFSQTELLSKLRAKFSSDHSSKTYDVRIINCFLAATEEVMEFYFGNKPLIGKPTLKAQKDGPVGYVSGLIALSGTTVMGSVSVTCDKAFALALAEKIFLEQAVEVNDTLIADLTGELCNQICGKVKINFGKIGIKVRIGLPEVILGERHTVIHKSNSPIIAVPVTVGTNASVLEFSMTPGVDDEIDEQQSEAPASSVILFED